MTQPHKLTFGIELEFLCVYAPGSFASCVPDATILLPQYPDQPVSEAGAAIYHALLDASIPATGHESLDEDINDPCPPYTRWSVTEDICNLSLTERLHLPPHHRVETVELSSRKLLFHPPCSWQNEIYTILRLLHQLELKTGCRFLTNSSTGLHVHVGHPSPDEKPSLRTAKNLLQLVTAFESRIDLLHAANRIRDPVPEAEEEGGEEGGGGQILYAGPSFFHSVNGLTPPPTDSLGGAEAARKANIFDWLSTIERMDSYSSLASVLKIRDKKRFPMSSYGGEGGSGKTSAYNFDNLLSSDEGGGQEEEEEQGTGTIEFRQHCGTLDFLSICAWTGLAVQMVWLCSCVGDEEFLRLLTKCVDHHFTLEDLLCAIGVEEGVIRHFAGAEGGETIGVLGQQTEPSTACLGQMEKFCELLGQNEEEQNAWVSEVARAEVMRRKDYGIDAERRVAISSALVKDDAGGVRDTGPATAADEVCGRIEEHLWGGVGSSIIAKGRCLMLWAMGMRIGTKHQLQASLAVSLKPSWLVHLYLIGEKAGRPAQESNGRADERTNKPNLDDHAPISWPADDRLGLPEIAITKRDGELKASERARGVEKRADGNRTVETNVFDVRTWSTGGAYYANVTVGTPPQPQVVILDTGSADLYFDSTDAGTCQLTGKYACKGGTFSPDNSSTYQVVDPFPAFDTAFGDGSSATGEYGEDTVGIGDVRIENVQFGLASSLYITTGYAVGLMGLGYSYIEAVLRATGVTNSRLYSVYLNDLSDISGTILFGGIDPSKYTGDLVTLNILPDALTGGIAMFLTAVTDLSITTDGETTDLFSGGSTGLDAYDAYDYSLPVLLDTGAAAWQVPSSRYTDYIAPAFPFVDPLGYCGCSHRQDDIHLTVTFGGEIPIRVPITDFLVPIYNATTREPIPYTEDEDTCALLIVPAEANDYGFQVLGDAILRSMYVVFDLDNGQLSIAQAAEDNDAGAGTSNPIPVPRGPDGIAAALSSASAAAPAEDYVSAGTTQSWSIAPLVTAASQTSDLSAVTASSTIGTATGSQAVPAGARVSDDGVPGGSNGIGELIGVDDDDDDDDDDSDGGSFGDDDGGSGSGGCASDGSSSSEDSSSPSSGAAALAPDWRHWWVSGVVVLGIGAGMGVVA
ncbi:hypothetical protein KC315_g92 [Hortaea werneckii]|nr:hypothetical protein KC315_g92 [Hortaea werneckii]